MTEDDAKAWLAFHLDVSRETLTKLSALADIVERGMAQQNLISASTLPHMWTRHIVDSAQLLPYAGEPCSSWIDLGSGAGFPGLVIAILDPAVHMTLVESRRKRIDFLSEAAATLGLTDRVTVIGSRLELIASQAFDVISARAFAPLEKLLPLAHRFSTAKTRWLLPKGKSAASELEAVRGSWQGSFRVVPSVTDPEAAIIVAEKVHSKGRR